MFFLLTRFRYFIKLFYYTSFFQGMQTRERAHCACSVFPFIKKRKKKRIGGFSMCWRVGNITPVPKSGSANSYLLTIAVLSSPLSCVKFLSLVG